jgi:methionine synthase II (cobalamin-independent)
MVPDKVHLVGSIALDSVEEVFRTAGKMLGRRLQRVPDGEPGGRRLWISWQYALLRAQPFLKADASQPNHTTGFFPLVLADDVKAAEVRFGELGYAREARASYQDFLAARKANQLPAGVRFQVSLPTPLAVIYGFCSPQDMNVIEAAYEKAMIREVEYICGAIPHKDLCIQWDVCIEMVLWDGRLTYMPSPFRDLSGEIMQRMKRLSAAVPRNVQLGFHLCYGDWDAKHFIEPVDSGKLVEVANALTKAIDRPITYIHLPVPVNRTDEPYFQPLSDLHLTSGTELYLGVVHAEDGIEGTKKRIAAASKYAADFGIATECGIARCRTPEIVRTLLGIHAAVSDEPTRQRKRAKKRQKRGRATKSSRRRRR